MGKGEVGAARGRFIPSLNNNFCPQKSENDEGLFFLSLSLSLTSSGPRKRATRSDRSKGAGDSPLLEAPAPAPAPALVSFEGGGGIADKAAAPPRVEGGMEAISRGNDRKSSR